MIVQCSTRLEFNQERSTTDFNTTTYEEVQRWLDGIAKAKPADVPVKIYPDRDYKNDTVAALVAVWTEDR